MEPEKLAFLYPEVPDDLDIKSVDDRAEILLREWPGPSELGLGRIVLAGQIESGEPPEAWATARRLLGAGLDRDQVLTEMSVTLLAHGLEALEGKLARKEEAYIAALDRLPLPEPAAIRDAYLAVVRELQPADLEEVDRLVVERLQREADAGVMARLIEVIAGELVDDQVVAWLADDRVVHLGDLTRGMVLTHRMAPGEESGMIVGTADLAPFDHHEELRTPAGTPVHRYGVDEVLWFLPPELPAGTAAGELLCLRVDESGTVRAESAGEPAPDPELVERFRAAYEALLEGAALPVEIAAIVYELQARDPSEFSTPRPPLEDLCRAAVLERRGTRVAHDEEIWHNSRTLQLVAHAYLAFEDEEQEDSRLGACHAIGLAWEPIDDRAAYRRALNDLADLEVAQFVADYLVPRDDPTADEMRTAFDFADRLSEAAGQGRPRAVANWFAAVAAERSGQIHEAEARVQRALAADPDWGLALEKGAWYASDRGDAERAVALLNRMSPPPEAARLLAGFVAPPRPDLGRNDPCWCGSGRRYKQCHLNRPGKLPLPERIQWILYKAMSYLQHRGGRALDELLELAEERPDNDGLPDPLVIDLTLNEGGWLAEFLAERGPLLPEDEAMLIESWLLMDRSVHEVLEVRPGSGVDLRDLATGDRAEVRERLFSRQARPGEMICARVVPDGESHQIVGYPFRVDPGTEEQVLDLCREGDPFEICDWVTALEAPPRMATREGETMVFCNAVWQAPSSAASRSFLDSTYETRDDCWVEMHELGSGDRILRATLRLKGRRITVETTSEERMNRVLDRLESGLGGKVLADERVPWEPGMAPPEGMPPPGPPPEVPPEQVPEVLAAVQEQLEDRWMSEPVPALAGLTPQQAAADPTRREMLERLLASFEAMGEPGPGAFTYRVDRLRRELGMD